MIRRRILITGASSGLGRGMALEFAARGRDLALCARRGAELEELRAEILSRFPDVRVFTYVLDVTRHDRVSEVFEEACLALGGLDRVIVNAGIGRGEPVGTGRLERNLDLVATNLTAALVQCEAAMVIFRRQQAGHLVTIASVAAIRGLPRGQTVYAATKAGLASLTEGIRADVWASPIRVSAIYPGYIDTPIANGSRHRPFLIDAVRGSRSLVKAIERERAKAFVPPWPWRPVAWLMQHVPLSLLRRFI
jgi:short-subunit dehydrogenase